MSGSDNIENSIDNVKKAISNLSSSFEEYKKGVSGSMIVKTGSTKNTKFADNMSEEELSNKIMNKVANQSVESFDGQLEALRELKKRVEDIEDVLKNK